ncbi:MAG: hypothetical protein DCF19_04920 [Pseudanabaena frigida]|uniref:Uncharacterized protein n=1 Tax=Pseudanabaena frigida TaxID=945775 RepID=A0A2W4WDY5_9CYAN|nr:MAG: hypothetical protein DCF19_04920 [Pseudanabaena frigida]
MRIVNRQPLNVELLTLDDGTQKIAWDVKQLQFLLGISDLLHQEELSSAAITGVNSSGIPTIETVIAILDELGLKDLYEVRYRKQYATIIPKTESKRPKVAMYVVQQQSELALSIHEKIWIGQIATFRVWHVNARDYDESDIVRDERLYIPLSERDDFFGRISEIPQIRNTDLEYKAFYEYVSLTRSDTNDMMFLDMKEQNICYAISSDQRFPSTSRVSFSHCSELENLLLSLQTNLKSFLQSNGDKPEISASSNS